MQPMQSTMPDDVVLTKYAYMRPLCTGWAGMCTQELL
jgi:hypothetical protein